MIWVAKYNNSHHPNGLDWYGNQSVRLSYQQSGQYCKLVNYHSSARATTGCTNNKSHNQIKNHGGFMINSYDLPWKGMNIQWAQTMLVTSHPIVSLVLELCYIESTVSHALFFFPQLVLAEDFWEFTIFIHFPTFLVCRKYGYLMGSAVSQTIVFPIAKPITRMTWKTTPSGFCATSCMKKWRPCSKP